jgi:CheY-like chemotaxis protein
MTKVLLADDNAEMCALLRRLFEMEGYDCADIWPDADVPASDRDEAADVVLLDVWLGRQSGLEILDELQSDESTRSVPVVMMSGMNLRTECVRRGAFAFLLKPLLPAELLQTIQLAVTRQTA